jgi:hypothetical protein
VPTCSCNPKLWQPKGAGGARRGPAGHFQCKNAMAFWDVVGVLGALWLALALGLAVYGLNIVNRWRHRRFPGPRPAWLVGNMARTDDPDCIGPQGKSFLALQRWAPEDMEFQNSGILAAK